MNNIDQTLCAECSITHAMTLDSFLCSIVVIEAYFFSIFEKKKKTLFMFLPLLSSLSLVYIHKIVILIVFNII